MRQTGLIIAAVGTFMIFVGFGPGLQALILVGAVLGTGGVIVAAFGNMGAKDESSKGVGDKKDSQ